MYTPLLFLINTLDFIFFMYFQSLNKAEKKVSASYINHSNENRSFAYF